MARRQKQEQPPAGAPAWMATFSDLMNLLLCFFVLLFSMSTVDQEKFTAVIASLQSRFSIIDGGGKNIGEGEMVGAGINQLQYYDTFYNPDANSSGKGESNHTGPITEAESDNAKTEEDVEQQQEEYAPQKEEQNAAGNGKEEIEKDELTKEEIASQYEQQSLTESEQMAADIEKEIEENGLKNQLEVSFNAQYVQLTLSGAVLFDSGSATMKETAIPLVDKVGMIIDHYESNLIDVEGHTDSVPIHNGGTFVDNNVLSMYRALHVADYLREITSVEDSMIKSSGRGDYVPIADNSTAEGRAMNRRVVIKIYNSYHSKQE